MHINRWALRAIRGAQGVTVSKLAADSGINQPHLSNIERGRRQASEGLIAALARALDVPIQAIVTEPVEPAKDAA